MPTKPTYKFFISYRRNDDPDFVEHIRSWFAWRYGRTNVFMDFTSIPPGVNFPEHIQEQIGVCDVMLVIITPNWLQRILDNPFDDNDWVRIEISEALKQNKIVIPVYIKSAQVPVVQKLPKEIRGMMTIQGTRLESGQNFIDRIEAVLNSIDETLAAKYHRKQEIEDMELVSPAPGLALGYYYNFLKRVGDQLVTFNDKRQESKINIFVDKQAIAILDKLRIKIIIPNRIHHLHPAVLKVITGKIRNAEVESPELARPINLYGMNNSNEFQLIDFPTPITVISHWLKRRFDEEGLNPLSEKALLMEQEELLRFKKALEYYIDDHTNDPLFREIVQPYSYDPVDTEYAWLADDWK